MYKIPLALVGLVLIVLAVFLYYDQKNTEVLVPVTYTNNTYNIVFSYPDGYVLNEHNVAYVDNEYYSIGLIRAEDQAPVVNGEGPTGITVDAHPSHGLPLVAWVKQSPSSNFSLGDRSYASTTVDGVEAISYRWSGLYEGETTAFLHNNYVVTVSLTRSTPEEHAQAYREVLDSMKLK